MGENIYDLCLGKNILVTMLKVWSTKVHMDKRTSSKLKISALWKIPLRKCKRKPHIGRKYFKICILYKTYLKLKRTIKTH